MLKFAKFTNVKFIKMMVLAAVVLTLVVGQPAYAQTAQSPSGTGKTMSAALLGKSYNSVGE